MFEKSKGEFYMSYKVFDMQLSLMCVCMYNVHCVKKTKLEQCTSHFFNLFPFQDGVVPRIPLEHSSLTEVPSISSHS